MQREVASRVDNIHLAIVIGVWRNQEVNDRVMYSAFWAVETRKTPGEASHAMTRACSWVGAAQW
jgi:hypothetical protein